MPGRSARARKLNLAKIKTGLRASLSDPLDRLNSFIIYFRGAPALGLAGTALFAYFQYLSNYENKVREISRDDLTAATSVFIELSNKLASVMTLQQMLYFTFADANGKKPGENALSISTAPDIYKSYYTARTELRQNISVYARRAEIFIDWPSDLDRDPAQEKTLPSDPVTKSGINADAQQDHDGGADAINLIGAYNFDCDQMFPESRKLEYLGELTLPRPQSLPKNPNAPQQIVVNWGSLKHQLVTFQYCFERIHDKLKPVREWASSLATKTEVKTDIEDRDLIRDKLDGQVARFNYFVALAMRRIEDIRIRYRPIGFWCYVPGIREITDEFKKYNLIKQGCSPIHYAGPNDDNRPG